MISVAEHVLSEKLANVYFIWGCGQTTVAAALRERYGFYVYSTEDAWPRLMRKAVAAQSHMHRECQRTHRAQFTAEMMPLMLSELVILAAQHRVILCEGELDYAAVVPLSANTVHLRRCGNAPDWVRDFGIRSIAWPADASPGEAVDAVARYFGFLQ